MKLLDKVKKFIDEDELLEPGQKVVVAVSGGPDSVCLLHLLVALTRRENYQLAVAHLNHGLRGAESDEDEKFVRALARDLGLPYRTETVTVRDLARRSHLSLEAAGRLSRYQFLEKVAEEIGAQWIAVGHTADDQVETVLLNFLLGSALPGLIGMRSRQGKIVRPLLGVFRREVESYLRANHLASRQDSSNLDRRFTRNRLRLELIPLLERYNPNFRETIWRNSRLMNDDYEFISQSGEKLWEKIATVSRDRIDMNLKDWRALPASLRRYLLRAAISRLRGDLVGISLVHVEAAVELGLRGNSGSRLDLPRGLQIGKEYDTLYLQISSEERPRISETPLRVPGRTPISGTAWELSASLVKKVGEGSSCRQFFDYDQVGNHLSVRARLPGDRFMPLGMAGFKKLQDFLVDAKVPRDLRDTIPVVVASGQIIWLGGLRIDERAKVTPQTRRILKLELIKKDTH